MKTSLVALTSLFIGTGALSASPYIVYSGSAQTNLVSSTGTSVNSTEVDLIVDLADPSSFGVLQYDSVTKLGQINIYPLPSPTLIESNLNFFGSVDGPGGKSGTAALSIGDVVTDASNNTYVSHSYATGPLVLQNNILVPARPAGLRVVTTAGGTVTGTVTFPASAVVRSNALPYPQILTGNSLGYVISATGSLTQATAGQGNFQLIVSSLLTTAANVGSSYYLSPANEAAISPVSTNGVTTAQAYTTFLQNVATVLGVTLPSNSPALLGGDIGGYGGAALTINANNLATTGSLLIGTLNGVDSTSGNLRTVTTGTLTVSGGVLTISNTGTQTGLGGTGTGTVTGSITLGGGTGSLTITGGGGAGGVGVTGGGGAGGPTGLTITGTNVNLTGLVATSSTSITTEPIAIGNGSIVTISNSSVTLTGYNSGVGTGTLEVLLSVGTGTFTGIIPFSGSTINIDNSPALVGLAAGDTFGGTVKFSGGSTTSGTLVTP